MSTEDTSSGDIDGARVAPSKDDEMAIFGRGRSRARNSIVAALAALTAAGCAAGTAQAASPTATLGVYRGAAAPDQVAAFEAWNGGQKATYALDFLAMDSWNSIAHPEWWADAWKNSPYKVIYSVPMLPRSGGTLATGATGAYNSYFSSMASSLVERGQGDAVLRIGWEFNGSWYPWAAANDPASFVAFWRQIVTTVRAVPGANFTIDWTPNIGTSSIAPDKVYPGDAYVDVIGMDAYDAGWGVNYTDPVARWNTLRTQPYGLNWHRSFAAAHGKPMSYPEWGLMIRTDGHGGGDNAYYVQQMHDWIAANNVRYHAYFEFNSDVGVHRMMGATSFPLGAAKFRELFGPAPAAAPSSTATPSPTPTATATPSPTPAATPVPATTTPAPAPSPTVTPAPTPTPAPATTTTKPGKRPHRATVSISRVRSAARRIHVAGRVRRATGGRVRVEVRVRGRVVRKRSTAVGRHGAFAVAVPRPVAGRYALVARYRGSVGATTARAVVARR